MMVHEASSRPPRPGRPHPVLVPRRVPEQHLQTSLSLQGRAGSNRHPPATAMLTATGVVTGTLSRSRCQVIAASP